MWGWRKGKKRRREKVGEGKRKRRRQTHKLVSNGQALVCKLPPGLVGNGHLPALRVGPHSWAGPVPYGKINIATEWPGLWMPGSLLVPSLPNMPLAISGPCPRFSNKEFRAY